MPLNNFDDSISWSQFNEFSARPSGQIEYAEINVGSALNYGYDQNGNSVIVSTLDVTITVVRNESWVVTSAKSDYLLKHEQGHYDITSLGARELYNHVLNTKGNSVENFKSKISELKRVIQRKINTANKMYDKQTDHSINKQLQETWDKKIDAAKKKLNGTIDDLP